MNMEKLKFNDEEEAYAYWSAEFGGNNKDFDKEEGEFMKWCNDNNLDFSL